MVSHMKTTVHITDSILEEARKLADREETTLRALIEEGLRRIISERKRHTKFRLRQVPFKGRGLQSHVKGATWDDIRALGLAH